MMTAEDSKTSKTAADRIELNDEQLTEVSGGPTFIVLPDIDGEVKESAPGGRLPIGSVRANKT